MTITAAIATAVDEGSTSTPAAAAMSATTSMTMVPDARWRVSSEPVSTGNALDRSA